jgi:sulfur carrier protein
MRIVVNGDERDFPCGEKFTISDLIATLGVAKITAACALNSEVVKKEKWSETPLKEGDQVELLSFVGGGNINL